MSEKKFYDIHLHTMNLRHPYLGAFIRRVNFSWFFIVTALPGLALILSKFLKKRIGRVNNLLSIMENDIGSMLLILEECILEDDKLYDREKKELVIGGNRYKKYVLTPLIIDFGYHHIKPANGFYSKRPSAKPVTDQVYDMFMGIKKYKAQSEAQLFEVYPFMGLNTQNYPLYSDGKKNSIEKMLKKYFDNYVGIDYYLNNNFGKFNGDISTGIASNYFAGIKVYPPMGFDPWPEYDSDELEKVKFLYQFCCDKRIPLTTHSSDGGYKGVNKKTALEYQNPSKWKNVLKEFPSLKLNLAHMGERTTTFFPDTKWEETVIRLISKYEYVYADFAYRGVDERFYEFLDNLISKQDECRKDKIRSRILFGTDFMINLLSIDSYNEYLIKFSSCGFTDELKDRFGRVNPEQFLFDKDIEKISESKEEYGINYD